MKIAPDKNVIAGLLALVATAALAETPKLDFSRYQGILDRKPFGAEAEAKPIQAPPLNVAPAEPPFWKDLRLCAITESASGTRIGFVNIAIKPPKSYLLTIGGDPDPSDDGFTAVEADFRGGRAKLRKGEEEFWLSMSGAAGSESASLTAPRAAAGVIPGLTSPTLPSPAPPSPARLPPSAAVKPPATPSATPSTVEQARSSYAERLRIRREALRAKQAEPPRLTGEDLKQHLEQYQLDLIRKGMPPLPLPLTREMDDQLVAEGVLPSQDAPATAAPPAP